MAARYRAVVIGCGRIGSTFADEVRVPGVHSHAQAYSEHPRTALVGVADPDAARVAAAAARWGVPGDPDPLAICEKLRPDIVSVCSPDATHAPLVRSLLERSRPRLIFVEKPLATSLREAEEIVRLARDAKVLLAVDHTRRYSAAFRALADELRAGTHGRPILARFVYGKGLWHNGVHVIDLARLWLGEPTSVRGRPAQWGPDGDETYDVSLEFADGSRALLEAFDERIATIFEGELLAERTRWRFWSGGDAWEFASVEESPTHAGYRTYVRTRRESRDPRFTRPLARVLTEAVDDLVGALDGASRPLCDGEQALATLRIIDGLKHDA